MKNILIIAAVLLVVAGAWYFMTNRTEGAVAIVNGEEISRTEYNELESRIAAEQGMGATGLEPATREQLKPQILDALISQTLLRQAAQRAGAEATSAEVDAEMAMIRGQFESDDTFTAALSAEGLTENTLRTRLVSELTIRKYLEQTVNLSSVSVTDEEVTSAYGQLAGGEEAPSLEEVRPQLEGWLIQQKQQELVAAHVQTLRSDAEIEILI
jgi:parvulin-like peptidyl-prolyl isomerase